MFTQPKGGWTLAGAGVSPAGRKRLPIRLMVGLLYLKHAYNESDETACDRWAENCAATQHGQ